MCFVRFTKLRLYTASQRADSSMVLGVRHSGSLGKQTQTTQFQKATQIKAVKANPGFEYERRGLAVVLAQSDRRGETTYVQVKERSEGMDRYKELQRKPSKPRDYLQDGDIEGLSAGIKPVELYKVEEQPVMLEAWQRGKWLLGLLVLQSSSSFVLDSYKDLIQNHLVITLFLTMLVGAGGNAGNQSAIQVIRGLATGEITLTFSSFRRVLFRQAKVATILSVALCIAGFFRVLLTSGSPTDAAAISLSLFLIVSTSVLMGTSLPFGLSAFGADPANAGTTVQVVMDVTGVAITCTCCALVLEQLKYIL